MCVLTIMHASIHDDNEKELMFQALFPCDNGTVCALLLSQEESCSLACEHNVN